MTDSLIAVYEGTKVGQLDYTNDQITFTYCDQWANAVDAFPMSLSMPLSSLKHSDKIVRPFIEGLLPDNSSILDAWGKRFHVSPRNPYRLLRHVGEDCAGAIQFYRPEEYKKHAPHTPNPQVEWLTEDSLAERIQALVRDHSLARRIGDKGQFSLAGAQPKTGLYYCHKQNRWGVPYGSTPTTHILKPSLGHFEDYSINEYFCLKLAKQIGFIVAEPHIRTIGDVPTIILKRYDRIQSENEATRVHQEDLCQALGQSPMYKYQSDGGPDIKSIVSIIRNSSSRPEEDAIRFLKASIFNWIIGGTDAHSKNYSFLIAGNGQVRLAPLYDITSCLPYPKDIPIHKAKLAMKIGNEYKLYKISVQHWIKSAKTWGFSERSMKKHLEDVCSSLINQTQLLSDATNESLKKHQIKSNLTSSLANRITKRANEFLASLQHS